jgi:hypothetical protein
MGEPAVIGKQELLSALRESGEEVATRLGALPAVAFESGGYENGWNAKGILAHVASIEWTYPRLIIMAEAGTTAEVADAVAGFDINAYNERQVNKRADRSVAELLEEFKSNRAATIAAVEGVDDQLLRAFVRSAGAVEGELGYVIHFVAVEHIREHVADITGA